MIKNPKTVLVTGCAGFIGSNFCKQFSDLYPETVVLGVDNLSTGRKEAIDKRVKFFKGTITNTKFLDGIFNKFKPEFVFHFAAIPRVSFSVEHPLETTFTNIDGTVALLQVSKKYDVKRFILSSSSSVYGGAKRLPTKEADNFPDPKSPYSAQKYADEIFCKLFSDLYGLDTISLRYFNVFGPGQYGDSAYSTVVSAWLESIYFPKNKKAFIEGNGRQSRDFCFVDNVVLANILAMKSEKLFKGEAFNIAHGERTTVIEIKKMIEKYTNKKLDLEVRPPRKGDVLHTHADITKAKKWFGYKPKILFIEGLLKTIEWFEKRKK